MNRFVAASKLALNDLTLYDRVRVILGNRTCDLDSAVSALVLGTLYHSKLSADKKATRTVVLAVMNIAEREYRTKTEVSWFLGMNGIAQSDLTFRDRIDLAALGDKLELILIDHHALDDEDAILADRVIEIIDHRPRDPSWTWPGIQCRLELVGSCATLVAERLYAEGPELLAPTIRALLRGTILLDTHCLSPEAGRATPLDREIIARLETPEDAQSRDEIYRGILAAKCDVSALSPDDLIVKDLKVTADIAVPVFPILVEEFVKLPGALESLVAFANAASHGLIVLMGLDLKSQDGLKRDLGILASSPRDSSREVLRRLMDSELGLVASGDWQDTPGGFRFRHFRQTNVRLTRKHLIPILRA